MAKTAEFGYYGNNTRFGELKADEFLRELRGPSGVQKYREMRDNDATTGAALYAIEQTLRDVGYKVVPSEADKTGKYAKFVEEVLGDMEHSLDDHISEALSSLSYGFATFEVVYKKRSKNTSKYTDGKFGVKKLASRAQWTINRFEVDHTTGDLVSVHQSLGKPGYFGKIPAWKVLHYKTTNVNGDWSGRSILRNAYKSYFYLSRMQEIEAIAIEREMHGIPVGRMPSDYLGSDATDDQKAVYQSFIKGIADIKNNEQGAIVLPSDTYEDAEGKPTNIRLMEIELLSAPGSRSIDMDAVIKRYQKDIARTLMAEFLMLGESGGSFALSKTKNDMFLKSLESYLNTLYECITRQLLTQLFKFNGINKKFIPQIVAKDVAPHDLKEIGAFLRNVNGAGIDVAGHEEAVDYLFNEAAEIPYDVSKGTEATTEEDIRAKVHEEIAQEQASQEDDNGDSSGDEP